MLAACGGDSDPSGSGGQASSSGRDVTTQSASSTALTTGASGGGGDGGRGGQGGQGGQGGGGGEEPAWLCDPILRGGGESCDCGCGAVDPDCELPDAVVFGCGPPHLAADGVACGVDARCVVPDAWRCDADDFADGETCDCECGAVDVDCAPGGLPLVGCGFLEDVCVDGECGVIPTAWTCEDRHFGALDGCDCSCGAVDPDCEDAGAIVYGCGDPFAPGGGPSCRNVGTCEPPVAWTCPVDDFDDEVCHCGCGSPDIDCPVDLDLPVEGCGANQRCPTGTCADIPAGDRCETAVLLAEGLYESHWFTAVNDYDVGGACGMAGAPGRDVTFRIALSAGQTVDVTVGPTDADTAIYLVRSCDDPAGSCVAGADATVNQQPEVLSYTAVGSEELFLVVDQYASPVDDDFTVFVALDP